MTTASIPGRREETSPAPPPRLLDVLQRPAAERGHSVGPARPIATGRGVHLVHGKRHPRDLTNAEVGRFLGHVAQTDKEDALRAIEAARKPENGAAGRQLCLESCLATGALETINATATPL